ncbi:MAG: hypothetical protein IPI68_05345 [Chitinophagaceae bacterium]|nr:hypothetical protein [Chitinophagaceae bacterium]
MKKFFLVTAMVIGVVGFLSINSCSHEFSGDRCSQNPILLSLSKTDATPSQNNGAIRASATGGEGFSFSLNGSPSRTADLSTVCNLFLHTMWWLKTPGAVRIQRRLPLI